MKIILILLILITIFSLNAFAQDFPYTSLEGHTSRITKIVFSSDGAILASTSEDRTIRLWDVATGTRQHTLSGHESWISSVAFSHNGLAIASADSNGKIRLSNSDGERLPYIAISGKVIEPPWDVNGDGSVDILDLSFVAARFGQKDQTEADVNADGVVDIKDLITVASGMDRETDAPSPHYRNLKELPSRATVQQWLTEAQQLNLTDPTSQKGILFLQYLLASLTPRETALLPNYPNPFNPETWIPYQLAQPVNITISIYTIDGHVIRTLDLGYKPSGIYQSKTRAAYWDGRNNVGESVASGVYFYTLTAGNYKATRRFVILK